MPDLISKSKKEKGVKRNFFHSFIAAKEKVLTPHGRRKKLSFPLKKLSFVQKKVLGRVFFRDSLFPLKPLPQLSRPIPPAAAIGTCTLNTHTHVRYTYTGAALKTPFPPTSSSPLSSFYSAPLFLLSCLLTTTCGGLFGCCVFPLCLSPAD